jgi:hypothetical protein
MSDYDSFDNVAESDLGAFEEALEISGYDAVTTTQRGMQQDEFLKESGMAIDTVGEAKKIEEKREKRERNSESGIAAAFEAAHQHVDNHEYEFRHGQISHGELKKFMGNEQDNIAQKLKSEKDPKKKAQLQKDMMMMQQMTLHMEQNGKLTEEQQKQLDDYLDRRPDAAARFDKLVENEGIEQNKSALEAALAQEKIQPDIKDAQGGVCLSQTFTQNSETAIICEEPANDIEIGESTIAMSNYEASSPEEQFKPQELQFQNTGSITVSANLDF